MATEIPFPQGIGSEPAGLVSGRATSVEAQLVDADEGCVRVPFFDRDDAQMEARLEPNESVEETYGIAGNEGALDELCPEPDTYRFEFTYDDHGTWGFEIELAET